jgi:hypothetical protein
MRVAIVLAGLSLAVVAIGGCEEPHGKQTDAVSCMAYLALQSTAVAENRADGDLAALDAAAGAWRAFAERKHPADELAQYFASSVAVYDEMADAEIAAVSARCAATAPTV